MKYKHIIWDFDGTLFDSYPAMATAFSAALGEFGITVPIESILAYMKISIGNAIEHFSTLYHLDEAFIKRFTQLREEEEREKILPFPGALELCRGFCASGGKNYLFTHRGDSALYYMKKYGLADCFSDWVTAKQGFLRKPSTEGLLYLINKHCFSAREALVIGDRELDILAGKNAGAATGFFSQGKNFCSWADINFSDFSALFKILEL